MADLEAEFQSLIDGMFAEIKKKRSDGDINDDDVAVLTFMVNDMVSQRSGSSWNDSGCSIGSETYDDDGWQPSMVC